MPIFEKSLSLPISSDELFAWHEQRGAFERLCPPWDPVKIIHKDEHINDGAIAKLKVRGPLGIPLHLEVLHEGYERGVQFVDRQIRGPFALWRHTHAMSSQKEDASHPNLVQSTLTDSIEYTLPFGWLGEFGGGSMTRSRLAQLFHYRHHVMRHDHLLHTLHKAEKRLHIAISGATGFIGSALSALLTTGGHRVTTLSRSPGEETRVWSSTHDVPDLSDVDIVIHLAGENIAQRWSADTKTRIMASRVERTRALAETLAEMRTQGSRGPKTLICASGIGYYGDSGEAWVDESSSLGSGFLAEVCEAWELASQPAAEAGIRVVNARVGVVLAPHGGALAKLLLPFSLGLGGPVASGEQWMSWISLHDVVGALYHCAFDENLSGPVNLCSPHPVKNREFTQTLGRVLNRPTLIPIPAFTLKSIFGEMAQETILSGQKVKPTQLKSSEYPFFHTELEDALRFVLGRVENIDL